jgi:hypothetical protein
MEDKNTNRIAISLIVGLIIFIVIFTFLELNYRVETINYKQHVCKEDSLREVVNNLKGELEMAEDGWDKKEQRYEDILFEYEYGIGQLKENRPEAYRYFHRIIGYRERYSRDVEFENKKRLNINKW